MGEGGFRGFDPDEGRIEVGREEEKTPEKKKIKKELSILVPKDFKLDDSDLKTAIRRIIDSTSDSIQELQLRGYEVVGPAEYPFPAIIRMNEIVGTDSKDGWAGLVIGFGESKSASHPNSFKNFFELTKGILRADKEERNQLIEGITMVANNRRFFVESDGRRRILALKALQNLGCDVSILGMKVGYLEKVR